MGCYKRKIKRGTFWRYVGSYRNVQYSSKAIYKTKRDAEKAERIRIDEIEGDLNNPRPSVSFYELCQQRLDYLEATKSVSYYQDNQRTFKKLIALWGKDTDISEISRPMVHKYLLSESVRLREAGKDNFEVNAQLRYIRALFGYAINELEVLDINPTRKLKFYPTVKKLKYIPQDSDIDKVCCACWEHQQKLIIFCLESGCRVSEALRATDNDIDLDMGLLTLWTRKKRDSHLTYRRIPLPERLRPYKDGKGRLFKEWREYPRFLEKTCREIGVKPFGFHAFRHRYASLLARDRLPLTTIQACLGHDSAVTTAKYLQALGFQY
ncbi:tyrosine-type recombinase/integrase [uncultured Desulfosarcina sp.]|uniref:tyrosine-type recombinase/integrase n=1 Tax=uncultured Desulfosarcina sp. TaxID=218289 RepID=UPI0029C66CB9|nr:tyrosine-type recombinase/integrase [uncultured Desulfosarcina sp.]